MKKDGAFVLSEEVEIIDPAKKEEREAFVMRWLCAPASGRKPVRTRDLDSRFKDFMSALHRETIGLRTKTR